MSGGEWGYVDSQKRKHHMQRPGIQDVMVYLRYDMCFAQEFDFYILRPKWQMQLIRRAYWLLPVMVFSKVSCRQEREDSATDAVYLQPKQRQS